VPRIPFVGVNGIILDNHASSEGAEQGLAQGVVCVRTQKSRRRWNNAIILELRSGTRM